MQRVGASLKPVLVTAFLITFVPIFCPCAGVITVPDDYGTIQDAIDASSYGDTVHVEPGLYQISERIDLWEGISLEGSGPCVTIIEAVGALSLPPEEGGGEIIKTRGHTVISGFHLKNAGRQGINCRKDTMWANVTNVTITRNVISGCLNGIGLNNYNASGTAWIINNTIIGCSNHGVGDNDWGTVYMYNNIVVGCLYGVFRYNVSNWLWQYNDVYDNTYDWYRRYHGPFPAPPGNLSVDPLFLNPAEGNYGLHPLSPCVDAGHPDPAYDDPDGTRNDIGALPLGACSGRCTDVTDRVEENKSSMRYNRRTGVQTFDMTLTNISPSVIDVPLILVVENISPSVVTLLNADGTTASGKPYFDYSATVGPDEQLTPGETSGPRTWQVHNPSRVRWSFIIRVVSGCPGGFVFDRADFRVLIIRDDNHNYEWWNDTWYVRDILISLGYPVDAVEEGTLLGAYGSAEELAEHFREYDVVWLSNPGCGFDDAITVQALKLAMDSGVGIVLQGDDAIISIPAHDMPEVEAISGLGPYPVETNGTHVDGALYDNNIGNFYDVTVASGHPLQSGIAGATFRYGDDIDTTVSVGASVIAWGTPVPTGYDTQKPVIAGYEDPVTGGKSATVLLTVSELEVYNPLLDPAFDDTLCDNIVLWVAL